MKQITVTRRANTYEGFSVVYDDGNKSENIAFIDGNVSVPKAPSILLNIDAHSLYGLSHPSVISRILKDGPQDLITTKSMAHNLFEHGMKSSLGVMNIKNNSFHTSISTFYSVKSVSKNLEIVQGSTGLACKIVTGDKPILLCGRGFTHKSSVVQEYITINLDQIMDFLVLEC